MSRRKLSLVFGGMFYLFCIWFFITKTEAQTAYVTSRCGVGSGVGVCDYVGDLGSQRVHVSCGPDNKMTVQSAQFGPVNYPVMCTEYAASVCNGQTACTIDFTNDNCEASGVLPATITEQVVFVNCQ